MTVNNEGGPNSVEFYKDRVARIVPVGGKIYDITEADLNEHSAALPAGYPANTKALIIRAVRITGTGSFCCRSVTTDGSSVWKIVTDGPGIWFRLTNGTFIYTLTVANDDWDIYALGRIEA